MGEMFWTSLLTSSIAIIILIILLVVIYFVINARGVKKRKEHFSDLHQNLQKGQKIALNNGIYGVITAVNGDTVDMKVKSGAVMEVSRYSISEVLK